MYVKNEGMYFLTMGGSNIWIKVVSLSWIDHRIVVFSYDFDSIQRAVSNTNKPSFRLNKFSNGFTGPLLMLCSIYVQYDGIR